MINAAQSPNTLIPLPSKRVYRPGRTSFPASLFHPQSHFLTTVRLRSQHPFSPQDYHQVKTSMSLRIPCASILYTDPFPQHHGSRKTYAGVSNRVRDIRIRAASVRDTAGNAAHGFKHRNEYEEVDHFEVSTSCFAFRYQDIRPESGRPGGMYALHV